MWGGMVLFYSSLNPLNPLGPLWDIRLQQCRVDFILLGNPRQSNQIPGSISGQVNDQVD